MNNELKLLIVGAENELYQEITTILSSYPNCTRITPNQISKTLEQSTPDVAIVLYDPTELLETIQTIEKACTELAILFLHNRQDFQLLREVTRVGATDYLVIPEESILLSERLQKLASISKAKSSLTGGVVSFQRGRGQVISFYSGKGGSGNTFISSAFAQTLKIDSTAQVLLIDLNLQYGGVETFLGIETNRSLTDLKPVIHELNESFIRNVTEKEPNSKLEILTSPRDTEAAEMIDEEYVQKLIRACKRSFDFIVVDLPTHMDVKTFAAMEESDKIYYVMNADTPSIRVLKSVEELLIRLGLPLEERMEIVMNNVGKDSELTGKDISRFIQYPITAQIRRDVKGVVQAVNRGEPIRKQPKEKKLPIAAKDVQKWVGTLLK